MLSFKKVKHLKNYKDKNILTKTLFFLQLELCKKIFSKTLILFEIMSVLRLINHPVYLYINIKY